MQQVAGLHCGVSASKLARLIKSASSHSLVFFSSLSFKYLSDSLKGIAQFKHATSPYVGLDKALQFVLNDVNLLTLKRLMAESITFD